MSRAYTEPKGIFHAVWYHAQYMKWGKKEEEWDVWRDDAYLPKELLHVMETAEHLPVHGKHWINSLFWFACICSFSQLNCLYLNPWVSYLLPFWCSAQCHWWGKWLLSGVKPPQTAAFLSSLRVYRHPYLPPLPAGLWFLLLRTVITWAGTGLFRPRVSLGCAMKEQDQWKYQKC